MFDIKKWENLTLNEIYHPIFNENSRTFVSIMFVISSFVYILTLYVVITQSTPFMKTFKYSMILQITMNLFFELFIFIYCPIFYFPLPFISYNTIFSIKITYPFAQGSLVYCAILGACIAYANTVLFRLLATVKRKIAYFESKFNLALIYISLLICIFVSVFVPLCLMERYPTEMKEKIQKAVPVLNEIYKLQPNTFGVTPGYNDGSLMFFIGFLMSVLIGGTCMIFILHGAFLYQMTIIKKWVSKETFSIHQMLHRAMLFQLSFTLVTAIVPILLIVLPLLLQLKNGSWIANFGAPMGTLFMIFDSLCLFYFVKPYRDFFISRLQCLKFLRITKVQPMPSRTLN